MSPHAPSLPRPAPGAPPVPAAPRPERFTLDNGLKIVAVERRALPQISARLVLPAGSAADPEDRAGVASLVGSMITEGTEDLTGIELNQRLDSLGASITARVGHDFAEIDLAMLSETREAGFSLMADVVRNAIFPEREFARIRAEAMDALEARGDEPANVADDRAAVAVFGAGHPYGRLTLGTVGALQRLRRDDLVGFHRARYRPDGSVLIVAGDFDVAHLREDLERSFGGWAGASGPVLYPHAPAVALEGGSVASVEWPDAAQGEIRIAGLGLARSDPAWIPAAVANYILGGSTITGRLGANLREEKGWTYGVRSGFAAGVQAAGWIVETAVDAEVTEDAIAEIDAEVGRMIAEPVAADELERAREALVLSLPRAFETPARIVARLATVEAYGLEPDYWERFPQRVHHVRAEDVQQVAAAHFSPAGLVRVAVGPSIEVAG